jgi:uncharacterized linocin/CFP29 family protein
MANGNNKCKWAPERWQRINTLVHDEAARIRIARRVLTLFGNSNGYVDTIVGHQVSAETPLSILAGQSLVPVELAVDFQLFPEQFNDEQTAMALATRAAYLVALAEDAVVLGGSGAKDFLDQLHVTHRNLDRQTGLFGTSQVPVGDTSILESILEGIKDLRTKNHHGEYCAIVSPDLYQRKLSNPGRVRSMHPSMRSVRCSRKEASSIAPRLRRGPASSSPWAATPIDMAIPLDAVVEPTDEEKGKAFFRVVEQFTLRVNDPTAAVALS